MTGYKIDRAGLDDIAAIGALFTESFMDSVLFHCGCVPKPRAAEDIFTLVYKAEPEASFVARTSGGKVVGYCFAPTDISKLWVKAVTQGYLLKWCFHWLTGRYGVGFYPVKKVLFNKLAFFRSAVTPGKRAKARILSIAVDQACRGQGLGGALMDKAGAYFQGKKVKRVRLEVRPDNLFAIRLYERQGFIQDGTTQNPQGEWLIMFKEMGS